MMPDWKVRKLRGGGFFSSKDENGADSIKIRIENVHISIQILHKISKYPVLLVINFCKMGRWLRGKQKCVHTVCNKQRIYCFTVLFSAIMNEFSMQSYLGHFNLHTQDTNFPFWLGEGVGVFWKHPPGPIDVLHQKN